MCIICVKPAGVAMPSHKTIKTMFENNPDGAGYMYYMPASHKVIINKGFMDDDRLLKSLDSLAEKLPLKDIPLVMHFRISTSGLSDEGNCHPFPISENDKDLRATYIKTDLGMAHNGVLSDFEPEKGSVLNDTQTFIKECVSLLPGAISGKFDKLINRIIGSSKLAFIDSQGNIKTYGKFLEADGLFYSNTSYLETYFGGWKYTNYDKMYEEYYSYEDDISEAELLLECATVGEKIVVDNIDVFEALTDMLVIYEPEDGLTFYSDNRPVNLEVNSKYKSIGVNNWNQIVTVDWAEQSFTTIAIGDISYSEDRPSVIQ